jgi:hypothetical protein
MSPSSEICKILREPRILNAQDVKSRVLPLVIKMWENGDLPLQSGKQWVVGYMVSYTHMLGTVVTAITMGPKKPSRLNNRYMSYQWTDHWGRKTEKLS